ncbi:hypothetical protein EXIGLDRAFT_723104 [Exidia glandulosa HHB12029]|uniref:Uncharacterized protein n=1 Tax=Exidia glandulosa HHB12029 TaxID=1314781 RepID=A0A165EYW1_EXIGL|nr:hypothetical protein EXIGLDRAFT_723104 [Exidia glandulosa HHB12029]
MYRTFCCCLPVRFGALVLALLEFALSGVIAALAFHEMTTTDVHGTERTTIIVIGCVFSLMAVVSLFGFVGAVLRSRILVNMFATLLYILVVLSLVSGVFSVVSLFTGGGKSLFASCKKETDQIDLAKTKAIAGEKTVDEALDDICHGIITGVRVAYIVILSITIIIQLYCAYIVKSYGSQLEDEEDRERVKAQSNYISQQPQSQPVVINNVYGTQSTGAYDVGGKMV